MNKPIIITKEDHAILSKLFADRTHLPWKQREVQPLEKELHRADIVAPEEVPADVITMNTRAELCVPSMGTVLMGLKSPVYKPDMTKTYS